MPLSPLFLSSEKILRVAKPAECTYCNNYKGGKCLTGHTINNDSFIEYECKKAVRDRDKLKIIVLYNAATVDKSKCPDAIKSYGQHVAMQKMGNGTHVWDYQAVKMHWKHNIL